MYLCVCLAKLVPLAYGIKKLQIACVVEDDKVCLFVCLCVCLSCIDPVSGLLCQMSTCTSVSTARPP